MNASLNIPPPPAEIGYEDAVPAVFLLDVSTPPAMPWDQRRAAILEAIRGAPLPMADLAFRLKRIGPWKPGARGQFAALFVKADQIGDGFVTTLKLGGRTTRVEFLTETRQREQTRERALLAGLLAVGVVLMVSATMSALMLRQSQGQALADGERQASRRLHRAEQAADLQRQAYALAAIPDRGEPLEDVLADMASSSRTRRLATPVEGFHWRPLAYGVEVRGDGVPYEAPAATRLAKPIRPDVWLWALSRQGQTAP